ncbi:hypothetical protein ABPG77_004912 [Micractinium sp. CCAP 211/92]
MSRPTSGPQSSALAKAPPFRRLVSAKGAANAGNSTTTAEETDRQGSCGPAGIATAVGLSSRPAWPQGLQFVAVEEASVVYLKAKVLRQQRCEAEAAGSTLPVSSAAGTMSVINSVQAMPGKLPLPQAEAPDAVDAPAVAAALQAAPGGPEKGTDAAPEDRREVQDASDAPAVGAAAGNAHTAGASASQPNSTVALNNGASPSVLCWDMVGEDEDHLAHEHSREYLQYTHHGAKLWSTQSTAGSGATSGTTAANQECFPWVDDPTVRVALGLGLDPRELQLLGGPGSSGGNPNGAAKALRFLLAHPAPAPSSEGVGRRGSCSHLRLTKCILAKHRQKAGAADAGQGGSVQGQVAAIDALLAAMKRRLSAVHAALQVQGGGAVPVGEEQPGANSGAPATAAASSHAGLRYREEAQRAIALHMREAASAALALFSA